MLNPEHVCIVVFEAKIPYLLCNSHMILGRGPEIIPLGTVAAHMLDDARDYGPLKFIVLIRILFYEHIHEANPFQLEPLAERFNLFSREYKPLGAATVVTHFSNSYRKR